MVSRYRRLGFCEFSISLLVWMFDVYFLFISFQLLNWSVLINFVQESRYCLGSDCVYPIKVQLMGCLSYCILLSKSWSKWKLWLSGSWKCEVLFSKNCRCQGAVLLTVQEFVMCCLRAYCFYFFFFFWKALFLVWFHMSRIHDGAGEGRLQAAGRIVSHAVHCCCEQGCLKCGWNL